MRLLFTTPAAPLPHEFFGWNDSLTDGMSQRFTKGQDLFTLRGHQHHHAVHLLAQNVRVPSDVLEHPSWSDFERHVGEQYAYVCISFMALHTAIVRRMCEVVRRVAPKSRIVLGGHGALAWQTLPEEERRGLADHLCTGEGVAFLRELLGDAPVERPIRQRLLPTCSYSLPWLDRFPGHGSGMIVSGLGCPAGCDFCPTTTMYGQRRLEVASPRQVFDEAKRYYREFPNLVEIVLIEEDHFREKDHLTELGRLTAEDGEFGLARMAYFTFGSISAISEWEPEAIARTGVSTVFVGVESKFAPDQGYKKRSGDARAVMEKLRRAGVATMAAWMGGFDFHTRENIREDLEYFISCKPTYNQLSRICPFPQTPLWKRLRAEGRLQQVPWEMVHFYGGGGLRPANLEDHELNALLYDGYRRLYEVCGATIMRFFEVQLNGWDFCRASTDRCLRVEKAARHRDYCNDLFVLSQACADFAPNGAVRAWVDGLARRYVACFGAPTRAQVGLRSLVSAQARLAHLRRKTRPPERPAWQEPFKRYVYSDRHWEAEGRPYRTEYPHFSPTYHLDRALFRAETIASGALISALDRWHGEDTRSRLGPQGRVLWQAVARGAQPRESSRSPHAHGSAA